MGHTVCLTEITWLNADWLLGRLLGTPDSLLCRLLGGHLMKLVWVIFSLWWELLVSDKSKTTWLNSDSDSSFDSTLSNEYELILKSEVLKIIKLRVQIHVNDMINGYSIQFYTFWQYCSTFTGSRTKKNSPKIRLERTVFKIFSTKWNI